MESLGRLTEILEGLMNICQDKVVRCFWSLFACAFVFGCSSASSILPVAESKSGFDDALYPGETTIFEDSDDREEFRIFHQGATGFVSVESVRQSARLRAADFCEQKGKRDIIFSETTSVPPHILGNFPRIEIIFGCEEVGATQPESDSKYDKLARLKELLDDGAITQEEFDKEKAKVLRLP